MISFLKTFIPDACIRLLWHFPKAVCANALFGFPGKRISCIAVAGTKGKTSTAFFLQHILNAAGKKTALFSTALVHDGEAAHLNILKMTTPDAFALNRFLARAKKNHCANAVIEASSHALLQYRVWGVPFSAVIVTNLAPDHLEYHASADEYQKVHEKLFSKKTSTLVAPHDIRTLISIPSHINFFEARQGAEAESGKVLSWWFPLQRANISTAITTAIALGVSKEQIATALRAPPCPPGRFESIEEGQRFRVIVDYAHSPESLEYFLSAMRPLVSGKLIVVFGACGDRDKTQRPVMGKILEKHADTIILTTDDPYSELPEALADNVEQGFSSDLSIRRILARKEAISYALSLARENDCVCILGKGAEQWQVFKDKKIPWDDREVVRSIIRGRV